jgi:hypothetical protein
MNTFHTFLPRWTQRAVIDGSGRDPLGLSRVSDAFTGLLLPSIITTTNRARYYSFYPWAMRQSCESASTSGSGPAGFVEELRKREAAFAVASPINQDMKALIPLHGLKSEYVARSLRCQKHKILILVSNAGHGTCRLDQDSLGSVEIGIPDQALQDKFSQVVNKITAFSERLASQNAESETLFSSLQQRAFRGEL